MRLKPEMIDYLSEKIAKKIEHDEDIILLDPSISLKAIINKVITTNMESEEELNQEVHTLLETYDDEIDIHDINYNKLFGLVKSRLVKERNFII